MSEDFPIGPRIGAIPEARERNWVALGIAAVLVVAVIAGGLTIGGRRRPTPALTAANAAVDPYAPSLALSNLAMSESANLSGGKATYLDGHIVNTGDRVVTGVTVQVLFRNSAHEVTQNETLPLNLIRMREPYIDTEPISADPLKPGSGQDFRLIFDAVSPDWDGAYPEVRVVHVIAR